MGEITEALRRAREERERQRDRQQPAPASPAIPPGREIPKPAPPAAPAPAAAPEPLPPPTPPAEPELHIPEGMENGSTGRAVLADHHGAVAECFRHFAVGVRQSLRQRRTRGLLITSAVRQDGKTTTACNLTLALSSMAAGRRLALAELDLRRPGIHRSLGVRPPRVGFERALRGEVGLDEVRLPTDTGVDLFMANPCDHAHEILAHPELHDAIEELLARYEVVVFDAPPVLVVPDVGLILPHLAACIAVARAGSTPRSAFRAMIREIPEEKLIGVFLNDARAPRRYRRYDYEAGDETGTP